MIPQDKINFIKETANIVEVISDFVDLKKKGTNYVGLSPFTNERTPSFTVNPVKGIYKDFSSGNGGDSIDFLMRSQNLTYIQSIQYLAKKYTIDIDSTAFDFTPQYRTPAPVKQPNFIPADDVIVTTQKYDANPLFIFLALKFGKIPVLRKFKEYYIGIDHTNAQTKEWVIFWQVDSLLRVRSGKYIKYKSDGHRCKDTNAAWHHKKTKQYLPLFPDFNLVQCFFGEHLLQSDIRKPIGIVESEKTAVIASMLMDNYIWLACGSKHGLNDIKCGVLKNRSVTLFPDLGAFSEWKDKALHYGFNISSHLEKIATDEERGKGLDLADYLLR